MADPATDPIGDLADAIKEMAPEAGAAAERAARRAIKNAPAKRIVTIVSEDRSMRRPPAVEVDYVRALVAFTRKARFKGHELDTAISDDIAEAVQEELAELFSRADIAEKLSRTYAESAREASQEELRRQEKWLREELLSTMGLPDGSIHGMAFQLSASQLSALMQSAAGQAILSAVGKTLATTAGKMMFAGFIRAAVLKVAASTALQTALWSIIKKVGIATLLKTALIPLLVAALPFLVAVKIPIFWVVLPLVGGFLAYEVSRFPQKLADKVPPEVGAAVETQFRGSAREIAEAVFAVALDEVASGDPA